MCPSVRDNGDQALGWGWLNSKVLGSPQGSKQSTLKSFSRGQGLLEFEEIAKDKGTLDLPWSTIIQQAVHSVLGLRVVQNTAAIQGPMHLTP